MRPSRHLLTTAALAAIALAALVPAAPASAGHGTASRHPIAAADLTFHPSAAGTRSPDGVTLWANGSATTTTYLHERSFRLLFVAEADWCQGPPHVEVRVDGVALMGRPVVQQGTYAVVGDWAPGVHHVSFRFTNDIWRRTCDRNLSLRSLRFIGASGETPDDVPSSHRVVGSSQSTDVRHATVTPASAGVVEDQWGVWVARLHERGVLTVPLDGQANELTIDGLSTTCGGEAAEVAVRVDGRTVHSGAPIDGTLTIPDTFERGHPLLHTVEIELLNPYDDGTCTRDVLVRRLTFRGVV